MTRKKEKTESGAVSNKVGVVNVSIRCQSYEIDLFMPLSL